MAVVDVVVCPTDCDAPLSPPSFNECAPEFNPSEIDTIYFSSPDFAGFTDVEDLAEWETHLTAGDIVAYTVVGDKPLAEPVQFTGSKNRNVITTRNHTLNFDVDETNDVNYEAMRKMQCGGKFRIWYKTSADKLYGGSKGVLVDISIGDVLARGDEMERFTGVLTWKDKFDPPRIPSPF